MLRSRISAVLLALPLILLPAAALSQGFEAVDSIPFPSGGGFPAYSVEPMQPTRVWGQIGVLRDNNVLRVPTGERADSIARYGAGVLTEGRIIGRQSLTLEAVGEVYDYSTFDALDHIAYMGRAEWRWELGSSLDGTLGYRRVHRLADIGELQRPVRDMIDEDRFTATGGYRVAPDWRLSGGAEYLRIKHSGRAISSAGSIGLRGGITHLSPLGNAIGLEVRHSNGDAPVVEELGLGAFPNNEYTEREYAATLFYRLGVDVRVVGRLGRTTRTYSELQGRDFSGTTGRGSVEWRPSAKTALSFEAYREPSAVVDADVLHILRSGVGFGASLAPTIKLVFSGRYILEDRLYQGDPSAELLGTTLREDELRIWRLGVGWEPRRFWQVSSGIDRGWRSSNFADREYHYTALMLNVKFIY